MDALLEFHGFLGQRVLLGVCGSIAAYKSLELLRLLRATGAEVAVTLTEAAMKFVTPLSFQSLGASPVFSALFSPEADSYSHLYAGRNAQAMAIVPATANTLAKISHGLADDMLSNQALSYPHPLIIAPAMNPAMWQAPATQANIRALSERGHVLIAPAIGEVACGDSGQGRLADLSTIYYHVLRALSPQDLAGRRVLLTLGPTREFWDGVRFLSNPSSGRMGGSLALAAWLRGAEVFAVHGPLTISLPELPGLNLTRVISAVDMLQTCQSLWDTCDVCCFAAAVADFAPEPLGPAKLKKQSVEPEFFLRLHPNPDIMKAFCATKRTNQLAIGFAAETEALAKHAQEKLRSKGADLIVGNLVNRPDSGFETATNSVLLTDKHGREESLPVLAKSEIAWRILDWLPLL